MKINPINLPQVNASPSKDTPKRNTNAGARLIKGYALVISNCVMAAIQNSDAAKAETKPEKI